MLLAFVKTLCFLRLPVTLFRALSWKPLGIAGMKLFTDWMSFLISNNVKAPQAVGGAVLNEFCANIFTTTAVTSAACSSSSLNKTPFVISLHLSVGNPCKLVFMHSIMQKATRN